MYLWNSTQSALRPLGLSINIWEIWRGRQKMKRSGGFGVRNRFSREVFFVKILKKRNQTS